MPSGTSLPNNPIPTIYQLQGLQLVLASLHYWIYLCVIKWFSRTGGFNIKDMFAWKQRANNPLKVMLLSDTRGHQEMGWNGVDKWKKCPWHNHMVERTQRLELQWCWFHWWNERERGYRGERYRVTEFRGEEVFVSRKEWGIHLIPLVHVLRVLASPCVLRRMRITCASLRIARKKKERIIGVRSMGGDNGRGYRT